jgi:hypothetical protein
MRVHMVEHAKGASDAELAMAMAKVGPCRLTL